MAAMQAITCLIDNVAELTDVRDRDELEDTLASAMFELTGAASLSMWRVAPKNRRVELRRTVWLEAGRCVAAGERSGAGAARKHAAGASKPALLACYDSKMHQRQGPDPCGLYREIFPVSNSRDVIRLLEIQRVSPLHEEEAQLILGLLRIYRNHLRMLEHSDCDVLTGLLNRRTFEESFQNLVSNASAKEKAAGKRACVNDGERKVHLAMIDIDFFKRINDRFGHPYGDEVLVLLSRLLSENFRDSERLFRFGGEEFLVMLPNTTAKGARTALQRFRAAVERFDFPQVGRVTVSIGYTSVHPEDSGADAFGRADQALYVAKQQGRNQVRYFEDLVASGALQPKREAAREVELF